MLAISASEFGSTAAPEMSVFQALVAGNASAPFSAAPEPGDAELNCRGRRWVRATARGTARGTARVMAPGPAQMPAKARCP